MKLCADFKNNKIQLKKDIRESHDFLSNLLL